MPKLTKRFVDALKPVQRDTLYRDSDLVGFALRAKPSGVRTWVVVYRNAAGRTRKLALGKVGVLTPEEARQRARLALAEASKGADPSADRHIQRGDLTIAQLVDRYLEEGATDKPAKKASSWDSDGSNLRRHVIPLLGRKQLGSLTTDDIQKFQRDVTEGKTRADVKTKKRGRAIVTGGPAVAKRATVVLSAMLQWATDKKLRADNPGKGVKLNKSPKKERFLSGAELARVGEAMLQAEQEGVNPTGLAIIRVLLLTGARKTEIASAKGAYLDVEHGALRLPDSKTDEKVIALGAPALAILASIAPEDPDAWIFPATRGKGYFKGMSRIWAKVAKKAGLKVGRAAGSLGVRIHDLRHGFASVAVADGDSLFLVGKILGHSSEATTERYAHLHLHPVQAVADRTARKIAGALKGSGDGAEVVSIGSGRRA